MAKAKKQKEAVAETYSATLSTGKRFTMRVLPKHYFLLFGQLPSSMTEKAVGSLGKATSVSEQEIISKLTPKQVLNNMLFAREAVKYACVNPKIVLIPEADDEISAFDLSEEEFTELVKLATGGGVSGDSLNNFR